MDSFPGGGQGVVFWPGVAEEQSEDENRLPEYRRELVVLSEREGPRMPETPDEEGNAGDQDASHPHLRRRPCMRNGEMAIIMT